MPPPGLEPGISHTKTKVAHLRKIYIPVLDHALCIDVILRSMDFENHFDSNLSTMIVNFLGRPAKRCC